MELDESLNDIKIQYLEKLKEELPTFKKYLNENIDMEKAVEIRNIVHKISGTAGLFGLMELSKSACDAEMYLNPIRDGKFPLVEGDIKKCFEGIINLIEQNIKDL